MSEHTVSADDDAIRLDRWFKRHYPALAHSMLEKHLRKGDIRLDGKKAESSARVAVGQVISIRVQDSGFRIQEGKKHSQNSESRTVNPDDISMMQRAVLYKDERMIVINKPHGLAVQGGSKVGKNVDGLLGVLSEDGTRPKLTHRLDRDTSGVLVLARNAKAAAWLAGAFADKTIDKTYWALLDGVPMPGKGTVNLPLAKAAHGEHGREQVGVDEVDGKYARTEYRVIDSLARRFAFVELKPLTGRMHQLRVHMQAVGCPIVGDYKYGGGWNDAQKLGVEDVLHLHARRIAIPAFMGGKAVEVAAPLPPHMVRSFKALGLDVPKR